MGSPLKANSNVPFPCHQALKIAQACWQQPSQVQAFWQLAPGVGIVCAGDRGI